MNGLEMISKYAGMREDLVQAGGGNSSCKVNEEEMLIKASGWQLSEVTASAGVAAVNPRVIKEAFLNDKNRNGMTEEESKRILDQARVGGGRPSIETFLHAISGAYTLHTHPIAVNALACRAGGMEILGNLFPEALLVPYATPGSGLAKAYFHAYRKRGREIVKAAFLANHGLLVSGESPEEVMRLTEGIIKKIEAYLGVCFDKYRNATALWKLLGDGIVWTATDKNVAEARKKLGGIWEHAFCPDGVVFLGKRFAELHEDPAAELEEYRRQYGEPVILFYEDQIYIHAANVRKALEIQSVLSFSAQVMAINKGCPCRMLTGREQDFLLDWDAEKYRKSLK